MDSVVWAATNVVAALMVPPGLFVVLLAIGITAGRSHRWARWLASASLAAFALLSLNVVGYALRKPIEDRWPPLDAAAETRLSGTQAVIVVLGGGRTLGALEYAERETLSGPSVRRAIFAARLSARTGLPLAVAGGGPGGGSLSEAELMKGMLERDFGRTVAVVEDRSLDTRQNANFMGRALAKRGIRSVILVTDVVHMPRAARAFQAAGMSVVAAPVHFRARAPLNVTDFLPSVDGLELSREVIREYIGRAWYAARRAMDAGNTVDQTPARI